MNCYDINSEDVKYRAITMYKDSTYCDIAFRVSVIKSSASGPAKTTQSVHSKT